MKMLRSLTRSESNRLPASNAKRSASIEAFGSSNSVLGTSSMSTTACTSSTSNVGGQASSSSPVVMITTVTTTPPVTFVSKSTSSGQYHNGHRSPPSVLPLNHRNSPTSPMIGQTNGGQRGSQVTINNNNSSGPSSPTTVNCNYNQTQQQQQFNHYNHGNNNVNQLINNVNHSPLINPSKLNNNNCNNNNNRMFGHSNGDNGHNHMIGRSMESPPNSLSSSGSSGSVNGGNQSIVTTPTDSASSSAERLSHSSSSSSTSAFFSRSQPDLSKLEELLNGTNITGNNNGATSTGLPPYVPSGHGATGGHHIPANVHHQQQQRVRALIESVNKRQQLQQEQHNNIMKGVPPSSGHGQQPPSNPNYDGYSNINSIRNAISGNGGNVPSSTGTSSNVSTSKKSIESPPLYYYHHNTQLPPSITFDGHVLNNMNIYNNLPNYHLPPTPPKVPVAVASTSSNINGSNGGYMNVGTVSSPSTVATSSDNIQVNNNVSQQEHVLLMNENHQLKQQIELLKAKVAKFEKFEAEIQKVYQAHEELRQSAEKKEKLERAVRYKLEIEVRRLLAQNKDLKEQNSAALATIAASNHHQQQQSSNELINISGGQVVNGVLVNGQINSTAGGSTESLSRMSGHQSTEECTKRELLIAQLLVNENKELRSDKEQQEYELQAQRLTLEEQRMHIDILDNALIQAQSQVAQLEGQLRQVQAYATVNHSKTNSLAGSNNASGNNTMTVTQTVHQL